MHRLLRRRFDCGDTVHDLLYLFEGPGLDLAHALARHNEALLPLAPRPSSEGPDMTETLAEKKCTPCRGGIPPLTHEEAERFRSQTPNWELRDDGRRIERHFRFRNFQEALGFVRDVGNLAETEAHHPWGYATISLRTKKIKGLHENDFIVASKIDRIFDGLDGPPDRQ